MDLRAVAKLLSSRLGDTPKDLDSLLREMGMELSWREKLALVQQMEGVEALYYTVSGKLVLRRKQ